jgi:hypothetical protein
MNYSEAVVACFRLEAVVACFRLYPSTCLKGLKEFTKNLRLVYLRTDKPSDFENWKTLTKTYREQFYRHSRRLRVASGATAPGPALEGAPRFRPKVVLMSLSSYILR